MEKFKNHLHIEQVKGTQLIKVSFESSSARFSADVVNELMRQFLDKSAGPGRTFSIDHELTHPAIVDFNNLGILAADIDNRVRPFKLQLLLRAEEMRADFGQFALSKFDMVPAVARCDQSVIFLDALQIIRQR